MSMLIISELDHPATQSHYLNLQLHYFSAPPPGGHLNPMEKLITHINKLLKLIININD